MQMLDRYFYACCAGNRRVAKELEISMYRKMRELRLEDSKTQHRFAGSPMSDSKDVSITRLAGGFSLP